MKAPLRLLMLVVAGIHSSLATAGERPPNVVFFLVDDLGWRDLGCYGSRFYETPHIDEFAAKSVRFTQAYAACPVCSPTRASIMTGKYPAALHLTDWLPGRKDYPFQKLKNVKTRQHLPFEETTLAEAFKEHGYVTAHVGKWHLGEDPSGPLAHGFDIQVPHWNKGWPQTGYHAPFGFDDLAGAPGDYLTDRLTDKALAFVDDHRDRPFFLYFSHFAVHDPIEGRVDLVRKYQTKMGRHSNRIEEGFILEGNPDAPSPLSRSELDALLDDERYRGFRVLPRQTVKVKQRQNNAQFAAMVESVDQSLGRLLARLKAAGLDRQTIVIFFSDNGGMSAANFGRPERVIDPSQLDAAYSTSNLPLRGGKGWLYEGGIRVPLIVKWPGEARAGTVCDVPVISTDFYPSLLEMTGFASRPDQHSGGVSFAGLLKGEPPLEREAIYWHFPHYSNHGMQSPGGAVRCGDYKLIEYFENGNVQLFNLKDDVREQHNLADELPQTATRLQGMLHRWRARVNAETMEPR
jgi:arylsulfatase A